MVKLGLLRIQDTSPNLTRSRQAAKGEDWETLKVDCALPIDSDMRPPSASPARTLYPASHFERNDITIIG